MVLPDQDDAVRSLFETAPVYHDIGLWTDRDFAYLEPSEANEPEKLVLNEHRDWTHCWGPVIRAGA